ncbi:LysR family transcriptional regulator [Emcibacter sp.]|uniref:LysR family transcriptional regulator n=1 Tax=Emcibacter sp. TaxID=1979954 RepID=UPI003A9422E0
MIELQELRLVTTLAEQGSFNRAAETLGMSQPSLTKKIARLEDRLGVTLFHRSRRGATPTAFGNFLLERGQALLGQGEMLQRQMTLMATMELGELRLGVGPVVEQNLLSLVLSRFLSRYPRISIDVRVDSAERLLGDLKKAKLDIAVGAFETGEKLDDLQATPLADQDLIFAARAGHPLLAERYPGTKVSVGELLGYPLAAPKIPDYIQDWFSRVQPESGVPLIQGVKCENYAVLRAISKVTDHITGGPAHLFREDFARGELCPVPMENRTEVRSAVLVRKEALHYPVVGILTEIFSEVSANLAIEENPAC